MNINKEKLKFIGGGLIVLAAASLMLQPLLTYVAGLGRMISFIISALLITYMIAFVIIKLKGKAKVGTANSTKTNNYQDEIVDASVEVRDPET